MRRKRMAPKTKNKNECIQYVKIKIITKESNLPITLMFGILNINTITKNCQRWFQQISFSV